VICYHLDRFRLSIFRVRLSQSIGKRFGLLPGSSLGELLKHKHVMDGETRSLAARFGNTVRPGHYLKVRVYLIHGTEGG
jgi:hypothetical protein